MKEETGATTGEISSDTGGSTIASASSASGPPCPIESGFEGCGCQCTNTAPFCEYSGVCEGDLVCWVPPPEECPPYCGPTCVPADDVPATTGGEACETEIDCGAGYLCVDNVCSHAWNHAFEMRVDSFDAPCAGTEITPSYEVRRAEELQTRSDVAECPGSWSETATVVESFNLEPESFTIVFFDNDTFGATDLLCTLRWDSLGSGADGPIPPDVLVDGFDGTFDGGCSVVVLFDLVE